MARLENAISALARLFGYDVSRVNKFRRRADPFADMAFFLRTDRPMVFDIGANVGQSIRRFRSAFPSCEIHSFEPSPSTFETLRHNVANLGAVQLWNYGVGASDGHVTFFENTRSDMSSFLPLSGAGWGSIVGQTAVPVRSLDQFCREQHIERIDILKSDTQGYELEVLKGARRMCQENRITLVYLEMIISDMYENLPGLGATYSYLRDARFRLVSFYEIFYEQRLASWTDALFVHESQLLPGSQT
jgi:FkbM family methyltransferase